MILSPLRGVATQKGAPTNEYCRLSSRYRHLIAALENLPEPEARAFAVDLVFWLSSPDQESANKVQQSFGALHAARVFRPRRRLLRGLRSLQSLETFAAALEAEKGGRNE